MAPRILGAALVAAATLGLGGCVAYDEYGYPTSSVSVGVGYGDPYYGWYDDRYYPGAGYYVYDRYGDRYYISDRHRDYWWARRAHNRNYAYNWGSYGYRVPQGYRDQRRYSGNRGDYRDQRRAERRADRRERRVERRERRERPATTERGAARDAAREIGRRLGGDRRSERRDRRQRNPD